MEALEREHDKYEHTTYYPVAVAANEDTNTAFVAVAWEYKNTGKTPVAPHYCKISLCPCFIRTTVQARTSRAQHSVACKRSGVCLVGVMSGCMMC